MSDDKAVMWPAWAWTCPNCGASNVSVIPILDESEPETYEAIREQAIENGTLSEAAFLNDGEPLYGLPDEVKCNACKGEFETEYPTEDDDEESYDG